MKTSDGHMIEFEQQLADRGLRGALAWLNGRTQYRYTALHVIDGGLLKTIYTYDRNDPADKPYMSTPVNDAYSQLVMDTNEAVTVTDSSSDARTAALSNRNVARAYCGCPLRHSDGVADGTAHGVLCHFDDQPRKVAAQERRTLEIAGKLLSKALDQIAKP